MVEPVKIRVVGLMLATGAAPVPASVTLCGLAAALSVNERRPGRLPYCVGWKTTVIVQDEEGERLKQLDVGSE